MALVRLPPHHPSRSTPWGLLPRIVRTHVVYINAPPLLPSRPSIGDHLLCPMHPTAGQPPPPPPMPRSLPMVHRAHSRRDTRPPFLTQSLMLPLPSPPPYTRAMPPPPPLHGLPWDSPGGVQDCLNCPAGTLGTLTGQASCTTLCPAGSYCPAGVTVPLACGNATRFCPLGSPAPTLVLPGFYSAGGTDVTRRVQQNECLGGWRMVPRFSPPPPHPTSHKHKHPHPRQSHSLARGACFFSPAPTLRALFSFFCQLRSPLPPAHPHLHSACVAAYSWALPQPLLPPSLPPLLCRWLLLRQWCHHPLPHGAVQGGYRRYLD